MSNRKKPRNPAAAQPPATYWNGLRTLAQRGTAVVADAPEFPAYWARDLVGQRINVVLVVLDGVNFGGGIDYLDDREGEGWRKVTVGHGSPSFPHGSLAVEKGSFRPHTIVGISEKAGA